MYFSLEFWSTKTLEPDLIRIRIHLKCWIRIRIFNDKFYRSFFICRNETRGRDVSTSCRAEEQGVGGGEGVGVTSPSQPPPPPAVRRTRRRMRGRPPAAGREFVDFLQCWWSGSGTAGSACFWAFPGFGSVSQRYGSGSGSGSFPFLINVLSGLKSCLQNKILIQNFSKKKQRLKMMCLWVSFKKKNMTKKLIFLHP
jgi:hypothetical protein